MSPEDQTEASGKASSSRAKDESPNSDEIVYPPSLTEDLKTERAMALGAAMAMHPKQR